MRAEYTSLLRPAELNTIDFYINRKLGLRLATVRFTTIPYQVGGRIDRVVYKLLWAPVNRK